MKQLLVILALATPAFADRAPMLAFGFGETMHDEPITVVVESYSAGVRVTQHDWLTASFGHLRLADFELLNFDERLWELTVGGSRMTCSSTTLWLCANYGVGTGYQSAGKSEIIDDFHPEEGNRVYDLDNLFVEGRIAVRIDFRQRVWLDFAFSTRIQFQLDRSSPGDDTGTALGLGVALHITP